MTAAECKPGIMVKTQYGTGRLLHPDPRSRGAVWLVYADGKAYPVPVEQMQQVEQVEQEKR